MRIAPKIIRDLIFGTPAFPAYLIGRISSYRDEWMFKARMTREPAARRQYVGYARGANRDILKEILEFRKRSQAAAPGARAAQGAVASSDGMAPAAGDSPSSAAGGPSNLPPGYSPEDDKYSYLRDEAYAERRAEEW